MVPYWLLFTLCAAGALQYRSERPRTHHGGPLLIALAATVILIVGLRYHVGGDWDAYIEMYQQTRYFGFEDALAIGDPGYTLLNWAAQRIGIGIWGVNLACAAIFGWGLTKFARKQPNPWLTFVVAVPYLIIVVGMGYTRQAVAIGLIMAGLATIEGRSILRFTFYVGAAALFHKTSILVLPLVALATVQRRISSAAIFAMLFVLLYYTFLDESADALIKNYIVSAYHSEGAVIRLSMSLLPAIIYLVWWRRFDLGEQERKIWRNFSLGSVAALVMLVSLDASTAVDRLALYLIPLQLFVLSRVPAAFSGGGRINPQLVFLVILYAAVVQFIWLNYATHSEWWLPYRFYPFEADQTGVLPFRGQAG